MITNKIVIASDHAGYKKKELLKEFFENEGIVVKDLGSYSDDSVDYPDFAHPLAEEIELGNFSYGITLCGSGNGINMTANKHQKIRSAICWNVEIAELARLHNDANICSLPARFIDDKEVVEIVRAFFSTDFEGGRHQARIDKIPIK